MRCCIVQAVSVGVAQAQTSAPISVLLPAQIDSLVAPIALYPDPLLSQVLVASTYPLQIVQAAQWLQQNSTLTGAALQDAAKQQNWDPSIQALVVFPDVLQRMSGNIQWTTDLGNSFIAQQAGVMDSVQRLRGQAMASSNLKTSPQQVVTSETQDGTTAIQIEPADQEVIYVPVYDPLRDLGCGLTIPIPCLDMAVSAEACSLHQAFTSDLSSPVGAAGVAGDGAPTGLAVRWL